MSESNGGPSGPPESTDSEAQDSWAAAAPRQPGPPAAQPAAAAPPADAAQPGADAAQAGADGAQPAAAAGADGAQAGADGAQPAAAAPPADAAQPAAAAGADSAQAAAVQPPAAAYPGQQPPQPYPPYRGQQQPPYPQHPGQLPPQPPYPQRRGQQAPQPPYQPRPGQPPQPPYQQPAGQQAQPPYQQPAGQPPQPPYQQPAGQQAQPLYQQPPGQAPQPPYQQQPQPSYQQRQGQQAPQPPYPQRQGQQAPYQQPAGQPPQPPYQQPAGQQPAQPPYQQQPGQQQPGQQRPGQQQPGQQQPGQQRPGQPPYQHRPGQPPGPAPAAPKPKRKASGRKRAWPKVVIAASVAVVLGLGALVYLKVWGPASGVSLDAETQALIDPAYLEGLPYDFERPQVIKPSDTFEVVFDKGVDHKSLSELAQTGSLESLEEDYLDPFYMPRDDYDGVIEVYLDPTLEKRAAAFSRDMLLEPEKVEVRYDAGGITDMAMRAFGEEVVETAPLGWWESDVYWVARHYGKDGQKLDRPQVTPVIIDRQDENYLPRVQTFGYSLAANGGLDFSWAALDGATTYAVILREHGSRRVSGDKMSEPSPEPYMKLAMVANTNSANSIDQATEDYEISERYVTEQNVAFIVAPIAEDHIAKERAWAAKDEMSTGGDYYIDDFDLADNPVLEAAVVAYDATTGAISTPVWQNLEAVLAQTPVELASEADSQLDNSCYEMADFADRVLCRSKLAITMADGHTAMAPAKYLMDTLEYRQDGLFRNGEFFPALSVELQMTHGAIYDLVSFYEPPADWLEQMEAAAERAAQEAAPVGLAASFGYAEPDWDAIRENAEPPASTTPEVPYPVNGSSDYVKFVAANILAENLVLDITEFDDGRVGTPTFDDVVAEAVAQNPYTLASYGIGDVVESDGRKIGYVYLEWAPSKDERAEMRQTMADVVAGAVDAVVNDGMTDFEKAAALNKWLVERAQYDYDAYAMMQELDSTWVGLALLYDAYPNNQNAYGVLVDQKGVCASYANAYKALADAAGLQAIKVSGVVLESGSGHAWNKVHMDGKWQVVDTTWNDSRDGSLDDLNNYFGLPDSALGRTLDTDWMVDSKIADYVAN
ncbi:MAG: hypothetical protein LBD51_02170 [Bifidobacteriaceae bacterium]|jgi:hypothetical protein|nr:hypothetical protein [Bifidobacteriaceae bacterium]